jgi:hypothetical protein
VSIKVVAKLACVGKSHGVRRPPAPTRAARVNSNELAFIASVGLGNVEEPVADVREKRSIRRLVWKVPHAHRCHMTTR